MNEHPVVPFAKLCRDIAPSPFASRDWINLPCHRCTSRFLFSGNGLSHRKKHKHNLVHRHINTGIDTARSGAQSEVPSAILDASQHLHGDRLLDHALLRLQYHKVEWYPKSWYQTVLHRRATTPLFRDCDIRHRRYRRCKFSIHVNLLAFHFASSRASEFVTTMFAGDAPVEQHATSKSLSGLSQRAQRYDVDSGVPVHLDGNIRLSRLRRTLDGQHYTEYTHWGGVSKSSLSLEYWYSSKW